MRPERPFVAVLLAAQRPGMVDPLATAAGLSHKCLVPIAEAPLIAHVARALQGAPGLSELRVVVEPEMNAEVRAVIGDGPAPVAFVAAADNLADSVHAATGDVDGATIVTTADNVLLSPGAVGAVLDAIAGGVDVAVAMATEASVKAAHPDGQRRFYRFRDDAYSNCNLYGFSGRRAFAAAESFRSGGQFAKKPLRLLAAVGVLNVLLMRLGQVSLAGGLARMGRRLGLRVAPVVIADGAHAIDVDNERTFRCAAELLARRTPEAVAA